MPLWKNCSQQQTWEADSAMHYAVRLQKIVSYKISAIVNVSFSMTRTSPYASTIYLYSYLSSSSYEKMLLSDQFLELYARSHLVR